MADDGAPVGVEVILPSGSRFEVLTDDEAEWVAHQSMTYLETFVFANPSDLADLDAIIRKELLCWRWETWLAREVNWDGVPIDVRHYGPLAKNISVEIRQLKEQLQIDKRTRDRTTGDGSVPEFIGRILTAAKLLGIHRSDQLDTGLELCMELRALTTVYRNSDPEERKMTRTSAEDIVEWILETFEPRMQAVDDHFQTEVQCLWVRKL